MLGNNNSNSPLGNSAGTKVLAGEVVGDQSLKATNNGQLKKVPSSNDKSLAKVKRPIRRKREIKLNEEFYSRIQQELRVVAEVGDPLVLGITSSVRKEGRTTVSLGMASAIAQSIPQPVVLLEGDLAHPNLADELGIENVGLSEYLRGEIPLENVARLTALADLWIIPAGDCQGQDLKTLRSERLTKLFTYLRQEYAAVIVDMPPILQTAQSARFSSLVDRILLVALAGSTPKTIIKSSISTLPPEKQAGIVLNRVQNSIPRWLKGVFGM
jgi:Mrp family chromosome partitioning ATPase